MSNDPLNIVIGVTPGGLLSISDPVAWIRKGTVRTLTWIPEDPANLKIRFIGFYNPTDENGVVSPITTPKLSAAGDGSWVATADNEYHHPYADRFFYTVYAEWNGKMLSSDPEVENEGNPPGG